MAKPFLISAVAGLTAFALTVPTFAEERQLDLAPFHEVKMATGLVATVTRGSEQSVLVTYEGNWPDDLKIEVNDGALSARYEGGLFDFITGGGLIGMIFGRDRKDVSIQITIPGLTAVAASSGSVIKADVMSGDEVSAESSSGSSISVDRVEADILDMVASSGSSLTVSGTCRELVAKTSSGAQSNGDGLVCSEADISASSGSRASAGVEDSIAGSASSGAQIIVIGDPPVSDISASSGGGISFRD